MKLLSLNIWLGIKYEPLKKFLEYQRDKVDIFCFQEMRNGEYSQPGKGPNERTNLFEETKEILFDFTGYFTEMVPGVGIAIFVRNNLEVEKVESNCILSNQEINELTTLTDTNSYPRMLQSLYLKNKDLIVHNFHGVPKDHKKDTPARELQTNRLLKIINNSPKPQIIVGDFNLDIDTEAISKFSKQMRDLIKEHAITTTRNANYGKFKELPFADYTFTSPEITINNFAVLPDEVSDHLAMLVDFE